ncbi:MAG: HAMP domain-containing sensor histidine kinase [Polyangiaceae bacterium]
MMWPWQHRHRRWGARAAWERSALFRDGPAAFVRARLHRRIFAWFGLSILVTGLALGTVGVFFDRVTGSGYHREMDRANAFIASQFAKVWDNPEQRAALAQDIARDFDVRVELRDSAGAALQPFSALCSRPAFSAKVMRGPVEAGEVRVCFDTHRSAPRWGGLTLFIACVVLWAASGRIARRLARPLGELARVAQDLGRGKLDSRVQLGCHEHGEAGVVAEAMNDMAGRIQKQLADQRELLATVSHELRTPLSRIRLLTEIARDGGEPAHAFDEIDREVVELDQLVGDLLASSRIDFSALTTKQSSAVQAARRAIERAGLDPSDLLQVAPAHQKVQVSADPTLLARALSNLIDNAARHGGGVCRVTVRPEDEMVAFDIEDEGPGLPPGEEHRIFEAFYQGNGAEGEPKRGTLGLGLALVRRIAEAHGGVARAETRPEGGARITLLLPQNPPPVSTSPAEA